MGKTLASRILLAVLGIMIVTMATGLALFAGAIGRLTDEQATEQARSIAVTLGNVPQVANAIDGGDPANVLPGLAERARADSGAAYVVLIDRTGVRYSHPNPGLIGAHIEEPVVALDGQVHTGIDEGSLGRSANARAPIFDASHTPVGEVSVGILESQVSERFSHEMGYVLLYTAVALGLGVVASLVLARAIKRATFGMEPSEIVALVQEREAMLHGIREGVIAVDSRNRVNVLNEEARRLLAIPTARIGDPIEELLPPGQLREIVLGTVTGVDRTAVTDDHLLVLNRMPVNVGSRKAGWVVTIRDRTELEGLLRQLDTVSGLTTALRAQEHEFSNRLHVMSVLLELGEIEEATRYSSQLRTGALHTAEDVRARIGSKVITALLLAKTTLAAERDVLVTLDPSSRLDFDDEAADLPLVTLIGNLVDNAIDAICDDRTRVGRKPRGEVTVHLGQQANDVLLTVSDDGPGIEASRLDEIFVDGYTTKAPRDGHRRGIGLALVHRLVTRAGGSIEATSPGGARFEVRLPMRVRESVQ